VVRSSEEIPRLLDRASRSRCYSTDRADYSYDRAVGHATGLGPLDTGLLLAAYIEIAGSGRRVKSRRVVDRLESDTGEDPHDGYRALVSLTQQ